MDSEKHCNTKIVVSIEDLRGLWADTSDNARLEILKSLIWTAPNNHEFHKKAIKVITSDSFKETLD